MDNKKIAIGGGIVGLLVLVGLGAVWLSKDKSQSQQEQSSSTPTAQQPASSEFLSFEIIPSQAIKDEDGNDILEYPSGANAVIKTKNASKVELWQQGGGTGIYTNPRGGLVGEAVRTETVNGVQTWTYILPAGRSFNSLTAYAYGMQGDEIGKKMLSAVMSETSVDIDEKITVVVNESSISVMKGQQSVQTIPVDITGINLLSGEYGKLRNQVFNDADVNFDGYNDLRIYAGIGYGGVNVYYDYYLFNPATEKFEKDGILAGVSNPKFDINSRRIISEYRDGPQWYTEVFQFNGSQYQKISSAPSF